MTSSGHNPENAPSIYGVVGYPVKHSLSPGMHNAAFKSLGINANYQAFEIKPAALYIFLNQLNKLGISGINLTVPHKELAFKYLRNVSLEARTTGTVNTITNSNGKLFGDSTDAYGLLASLKEEFKLASLRNKSILLLGAGGAASAVAKKLALSGIKTLYISNRTQAKAAKLAERTEAATSTRCVVIPMDDKAISMVIADVDILINATSAGLKLTDNPPVTRIALRKSLLVYDMIYNPPITPLLREAKKAGARGVNGLGMLLHQGARAFTMWTGKKAPLSVMRTALNEATKYPCKQKS